MTHINQSEGDHALQGNFSSDEKVMDQSTHSENNIIKIIELEIRDHLDIRLPTYLKNVLVYTGYDSGAALSELTETDFTCMECFVRNELQDILALEANVQYENFYGIYTNNKSKFKILPGHRKLLMEIQKFYRGKKMAALGKGLNRTCSGFLVDEKKSRNDDWRNSKRKQADRNSEMIDGPDSDQFDFYSKRQRVESAGNQLKISKPSEGCGDLDETSEENEEGQSLFGMLNSGFKISEVI